MRRILTSSIEWNTLSERIRREQRSRERFYPTVSAYRWWARRPHALIGALIERAIDVFGDNITVSDPMSGGGTVAVEAARRGLKVYAQDINPWAAFGLKTVLQPVDPDELDEAGRRLLERLQPLRSRLYAVPDRDELEIIYQLHVRRVVCPSCGGHNYLYPTYLLALDKRITQNATSGWYGCPGCGAAIHGSWPNPPEHCAKCGHTSKGDPNAPRIRNLVVECARCETEIAIRRGMLHEAPWIPVLAQVAADGETEFLHGFRPPEAADAETEIGKRLGYPIPDGVETSALTKWGHRTWRDLYTARQLQVVNQALQAVPDVAPSDAVADRLRLAIAGFGEMAGYASRWDPRYRKAYEVAANHHYGRVLLSAEVNPLGPLGRGTLPRRLDQAVRAARAFSGSHDSRVVVGSSEKQSASSASVDVTITDPPYFESVQYGELSRIFVAFAHACGLPMKKSYTLWCEAVPNRICRRDAVDYEDILARILTDTARTLKSDGRLILTFHSRHLEAWDRFAGALLRAGFRVIGYLVVHAENETDYPKRNRGAMTSDLIIECAKSGNVKRAKARLYNKPSTVLEKNLAAIGYALVARCDERADEGIRTRYRRRLRRYGVTPLMT